jgi:hypothetical protein
MPIAIGTSMNKITAKVIHNNFRVEPSLKNNIYLGFEYRVITDALNTFENTLGDLVNTLYYFGLIPPEFG